MESSFIVDCSEPAKVDVFMNANKKDFTHVFTTSNGVGHIITVCDYMNCHDSKNGNPS